jgi:hypothetical protein
MNRKEVRKLVEITGIATLLFVVPVGYFYYRDQIGAKWNTTYEKSVDFLLPYLFIIHYYMWIINTDQNLKSNKIYNESKNAIV